VLCEQAWIRPAASWVAVRSVHVAGVVQLPGAALAHGDHRQPARRGPGREARPGDRQGGFERRGRQVGKLGGHLVKGHLPGEVPCRERQQPAPVRDPERRHRAGSGPVGRPRHRLGVRGPGADRREQLAPHLIGLRCVEWPVAGQDPPVIRMPGEVIPERRAGPQHRGQPGPQPRVVVQRLRQLGVTGHPGQRGQRQVGVRGGGQCLDQNAPGPAGVDGQVLGEQ